VRGPVPPFRIGGPGLGGSSDGIVCFAPCLHQSLTTSLHWRRGGFCVVGDNRKIGAIGLRAIWVVSDGRNNRVPCTLMSSPRS
jgi:hypothetical protein